MKIAYFDCFSGISGNMILGALIDAGVEIDDLEKELSALNLPGYSLHVEKVMKKSMSALLFRVKTSGSEKTRNLDDITNLLDKSSIDSDIKDQAKRVFKKIAGAEAKIHGKDIREVHFHEVGAVDSIIDIVGTLIAIRLLGIEEVHSSRIPLGSGSVNTMHGVIPVPAPATVELLKGIPVYSKGIESELTTPTGAALISFLATGFDVLPEMKIESTGYGAGSRDLEIPNILRVFIGESNSLYNSDEKIIKIETNIDDMIPEMYEYVSDRLLQFGVRDVYTIPIIMKKSRPGVILTVLTDYDKIDGAVEIIFSETTTAGVRINSCDRRTLDRRVEDINTIFGKVRVKIISDGGSIKTIAPEYDVCKKIAQSRGIPLKKIYDEAVKEAQKQTEK